MAKKYEELDLNDSILVLEDRIKHINYKIQKLLEERNKIEEDLTELYVQRFKDAK